MDGAGKPLTITAATFGGTILIFCCLIAYLISLPLSWFADHEDLLTLRQEYQGTVSGGGAELAAIAESEYAQYGNTSCGSRYWTAPHDWCSDFVYWCADQLGLVGSDQLFGSWTSYVPTAIDHSHTVFRLPAPHGPSGSEQPQLSVSPADFCNLVDCEIYRLSGRCCAGTRAVYRQESLSQPEGLLFVQLLLPHSDPGGRATLGITDYSIPCFAEIDKSWRWSDF